MTQLMATTCNEGADLIFGDDGGKRHDGCSMA
jgi:hypothetical protein